MTAFSRCEHRHDNLKMVWELRTVNHRYLDVHLRLPEIARQFEPQVRASLQQKLHRGRVDVTAIIEASPDAISERTLDAEAMQIFQHQQIAMKKAFASARDLSIYELMQLPGIFRVNEQIDDKQLEQGVLAGLESGLNKLLVARQLEGEKIQKMLEQRLLGLRDITNGLRVQMPALEEGLIKRWQNKLAELRGTNVAVNDNTGGADGLDAARINQEMALLMTKSDVAEELDRLDAHIDECDRILKKGGAVGRRLDFMMQELNREANTLGSKAYHQAMTASSVELKVLIDQMREQIQNVE